MDNHRTGLSARAFAFALLAWLLLINSVLPASAQTVERPSGWTDESHGNRVPANYDVVLPDDSINEIHITFTPEAWAAEEADMTEIYGQRGEAGTGFGRRGRAGAGGDAPGAPPQMRELIVQVADALDRSEEQLIEAMQLMPDFEAVAEALAVEVSELVAALPMPGGASVSAGAVLQQGGEGGRLQNLQLARNPIWTPVTIQFADGFWEEVGFRYKGNSTLAMGWADGRDDLPFKLDFDEFEDEHPALDNQRFYGFKQLSFSNNNFFDPSMQREKVTADIFRDAGVPAPQTAYYAVHVDKGDGEGSQYWGLYTAIELPDDTLIETQFDDDDGNMYKPAGDGASFAFGSFDEDSFDKETNRDSGYEDVLAVFDALHAESRLSDSSVWRAGLEAVFDVAGFLRWLAANTLLQNFDTYGILAHNYYLYADATSGQLVWIPWDNNIALWADITGFTDSNISVMRRGIPNFGTALSLDLDIDPDRWPLIGFLLADETYKRAYREEVTRISSVVFTPERMVSIYEANYQMLAAYLRDVGAHDDLENLREATDGLIAHVQERAEAAAVFLQA